MPELNLTEEQEAVLKEKLSESLQAAGSTDTDLSLLGETLAQLKDGVQSLKDGMEEFDREGIKELSNLAGDDMASILTRIRALKEADARCQNFAGIREGQTGSVRFMIETEEIGE